MFSKGLKEKKDLVYEELKHRLNLENKRNPEMIKSERMTSL